jgi:hypothetical protein
MKLSHAVAAATVIGTLIAGSVQAGSGGAQRATYSPPVANVIIKRSPNVGYQQQLRFYVDGRFFTVLGYGRSFEGVLPAGEHLVTISQVPHLNDAYPVHYQRIHVMPGRSNVFTATWVEGGSRIALDPS